MRYVIGLLTGVLALDSLLLIVLVLAQPSKKDAGPGAGFGGGATDVLLGAGSGTALTMLTKWCAGIFLGLCLLLSILNTNMIKSEPRSIQDALRRVDAAPGPAPSFPANMPKASPAPATPPANTSILTPSTNTPIVLSNTPSVAAPQPAAVPVTVGTVTQGDKVITITPAAGTPAPAPAPEKK